MVDRGRAERVGSADDHAALESAEELGELADGRGLADAVHPDDEHHGRPFGELQRGVELREMLFERLTEHALQILRIGGAETLDLLTQFVDDALADVRTEVRRDQRRLEVFPRRLVDRGLDEHPAQCAGEGPGLLRHGSSLRVPS